MNERLTPYLTFAALDLSALIGETKRDSDGGLAAFLGVVRNENEGRSVEKIEYTAYEPMAELEMERIAGELRTAFPGTRVAMRHRLGILPVGEASVAIVAASPHRNEAFAACREAIEKIKARVPIWKKEMG
jgi:molybdopterin synthase catalytic subunit